MPSNTDMYWGVFLLMASHAYHQTLPIEQKLARDRVETISTKPSFRRKAKSPSPQKSSAGDGGGDKAAMNAEINRQTLAVVTQMVKEGKMTAEEAKRHARALVSPFSKR